MPLDRVSALSLRRESATPTRPRPNSASVAGSGVDTTLVQRAASRHTLVGELMAICGHPGDSPIPDEAPTPSGSWRTL
jgi:hypothetical protein